MKTLGQRVIISVVSLSVVACATSAEPSPSRSTADGGADSSAASGASAGGASVIAQGGGMPTTTGGADTGPSGLSGAGTDIGTGGSVGGSGTSSVAGSFTSAGSSDGGGEEGTGTSPIGTAVIDISAFALTGCSQTVSATDLAAKNNGLTAPKPTQSFADGVFTVDYTSAGQYGQVGIDFPDTGVDLTGCTLSVTLSASSWPACGVYAVPFFYDGTLGTVAPYDAGAARFVGEQVSNLNGASASIAFKATGAALTMVGRVGLNVYNCPTSVTVGDL